MTECIVCSSELNLQNETTLNGIVLCDSCGVDLQITAVDPAIEFRLPEDDIYWGE